MRTHRYQAMSPGPHLLRFICLYAAQFSAYGVASPFLPGLLMQDGLGPDALGIVLASGTAIRLVAGPYGGRLADRLGRAPAVFAGYAAAAALIAVGYAPARGLALLLLVSVAHAAVLAPLTPIADALALGSARQGQGFEYGWVRAAGSAAFIGGTLVSGQLVDDLGLGVIIWSNAGLLAATAALGWFLPNRVAGIPAEARPKAGAGALRTLFAIPVFRRLMLVAALIGGSHALHDSFEVIRWRDAGLSAVQTSLLWSLSVIGEVAIFVYIGSRLLNRLGPARAIALSATAGVVRWSLAALTAWFPVMAVVEPLHGLTFALLHLACMDVIGRNVPTRLAATAQAFYATVAMGAAASAVTVASGPLYSRFGAGAFWAMAGMCLAALPLTPGLRRGASRDDDAVPRPSVPTV
jgi:PPP family 3-phenylpropionic acid transporter